MAQRDRHQPTAAGFGLRVQTFGLALIGALTEDDWLAFVAQAASAIGMTPAYEAQTWHFPVEDRGGKGLMVVQPITESFVVVDTWPDHDGAYLHIVSCKPFVVSPLYTLANRWGLRVGQELSGSLGLSA